MLQAPDPLAQIARPTAKLSVRLVNPDLIYNRTLALKTFVPAKTETELLTPLAPPMLPQHAQHAIQDTPSTTVSAKKIFALVKMAPALQTPLAQSKPPPRVIHAILDTPSTTASVKKTFARVKTVAVLQTPTVPLPATLCVLPVTLNSFLLEILALWSQLYPQRLSSQPPRYLQLNKNVSQCFLTSLLSSTDQLQCQQLTTPTRSISSNPLLTRCQFQKILLKSVWLNTRPHPESSFCFKATKTLPWTT